MYIYQHKEWPSFIWDHEILFPLVARIKYKQGFMQGKLSQVGLNFQQEVELNTKTNEIVSSFGIEGEVLEPKQVRSSIARKLGMDVGGLVSVERNIEGVVEMMLDATENYALPLTSERLFGWHATLFPTGYSGMYPVQVGMWRDDSKGPMQVISGPMGKERIHFEAPKASQVPEEMNRLLLWYESGPDMDWILKAGIAHLWFLTIHPFDDGNGRMARAITDMALARSEKTSKRYYSLSSQILHERENYYKHLEYTQKGGLDITEWLEWFLESVYKSIELSEEGLEEVLKKSSFWRIHHHQRLNERQVNMINRLLDGFVGKLTTSKWGKISKCSQDSAYRDITDLIEKGILRKSPEGGRNTSYELILP